MKSICFRMIALGILWGIVCAGTALAGSRQARLTKNRAETNTTGNFDTVQDHKEGPMKISGFAHIRFHHSKEANDGFDVRRARVSIKGSVAPRIRYKIQGEFGGTQQRLIDAEACFSLGRGTHISAGQFKIPFSRENLTGNPRLETINRSLVVESLCGRGKDVIGNQSGRDIGMSVHGDLGKLIKGLPVTYTAGIFNGSGINTRDYNDSKDLVARVCAQPVKGVSLGGSWYYGSNTDFTGAGRGEDRRRAGAECSAAGSGFLAQAEYITGKDGSVKRDGWYVLCRYEIARDLLHGVLRYEVFDPDTDISENSLKRYTAGLTLFFTDSSKIQVNYEHECDSLCREHINRLMAQIQCSF